MDRTLQIVSDRQDSGDRRRPLTAAKAKLINGVSYSSLISSFVQSFRGAVAASAFSNVDERFVG